MSGLDLLQHGRLDFEAPDLDAFPCLRLAFDALQAGGTAPAMLNAANEVAVSAFLQRRIAFLSIPALVAYMYLRKRIDNLLLEVERHIDELLAHLYH